MRRIDAQLTLRLEREGDRYCIMDNPNSRWDGWVIGGRWGSMPKLLPGRQGHTAIPLEFDPEVRKILNQPPPEIWQPTPGYFDQARKCDIDWVGMRAEAGSRVGTEWDLVRAWTKGVPWSAWAEVGWGASVIWAHFLLDPVRPFALDMCRGSPCLHGATRIVLVFDCDRKDRIEVLPLCLRELEAMFSARDLPM